MSDANLNDLDISRLSENQKKELQQFLENETKKQRLQATVHNLTNLCFKKCITGTIRSSPLEKNEEACISNCSERFVDMSGMVIRHLADMRGT